MSVGRKRPIPQPSTLNSSYVQGPTRSPQIGPTFLSGNPNWSNLSQLIQLTVSILSSPLILMDLYNRVRQLP